jgi:hypothetical protein
MAEDVVRRRRRDLLRRTIHREERVLGPQATRIDAGADGASTVFVEHHVPRAVRGHPLPPAELAESPPELQAATMIAARNAPIEVRAVFMMQPSSLENPPSAGVASSDFRISGQCHPRHLSHRVSRRLARSRRCQTVGPWRLLRHIAQRIARNRVASTRRRDLPGVTSWIRFRLAGQQSPSLTSLGSSRCPLVGCGRCCNRLLLALAFGFRFARFVKSNICRSRQGLCSLSNGGQFNAGAGVFRLLLSPLHRIQSAPLT